MEKFSPCPPGSPGERRWFPAKGGGFCGFFGFALLFLVNFIADAIICNRDGLFFLSFFNIIVRHCLAKS